MEIETFDYFLKEPKLSVFQNKFEDAKFIHFGIRDELTGISGFGGASESWLSQTKATFELFERTVFRTFAKDELSSSGWAAHAILEKARENAKLELIERDVVLSSWLLRIAPKIVNYVHFDSFNQSFPILQFGSGTNLFILGTVLKLKNFNAKMLLSTTSSTLEEGYEKLVVDSERAKALLSDIENFDNQEILVHHNQFCSLPDTELSWIYSDGIGIKCISDIEFEFREFKLQLWNNSTAFVVQAKSSDLQKLFYGDSSEYINYKRLLELSPGTLQLNPFWHPIL